MKYYSVMLNVNDKLAVIIGGGDVALRKARELLQCGASVKIVSPEIDDQIYSFKKEYPEKIDIIKREYEKGDLAEAFMVFSATDSMAVNRLVSDHAGKEKILCNIADDPETSSFFVNSTRTMGDLSFSISTHGASPAMAAKLSRDFESILPANIDVILDNLRLARDVLKNHGDFADLDSENRGNIFRKVVNSEELLERLGNLKDRESITDFLISVK